MPITPRARVRIVSCKDDPRAAGRTGQIVDEVPPGPRTAGRWTVKVDAFWVGSALCTSSELQPI